ncbi:MAG: single-stranded DNA-binding protein [Bacteroidales bacterium]|nr:single-stranded DNA-binding protein [Bacteroidales bacterium]
MASGVNKAILIGNLGKDPVVKHLDSGASVANFPIATTESYKNRDGQRVDQTEWHNIVAWRGLAEVAEKYLKKGDKVFIEGRIRTRSYEKEGQKHYMTEIQADNMTMLGGGAKRDSSTPEYNAPEQNQQQQFDEPQQQPDDDLPF